MHYRNLFLSFAKLHFHTGPFVLSLLSYSKILKKLVLHKILKTPTSIMIEPICGCNLSCPLCTTPHKFMTRKKGVMKYETFQKLLDNIKNYVIMFNFDFAGEPFLHPELFKMVKAASENDIFTLVDTNSTLITNERIPEIFDSNLKILIVNIDNIDPDDFKDFREGANFKSTMEQIKKLCQLKKAYHRILPIILAEVIVTRKNEDDLDFIRDFALNEIGVDLVWFKDLFFPLQSKGFTKNNNFLELVNTYLPIKTLFKRYEKREGKLFLVHPSKKCRWRRQSLILWDGTVAACCIDYNGEYTFGNILKDSFLDIWYSKKYKHYRKKLIKTKKMDLCKKCSI